MAGDNVRRHCRACARDVVDLSALTAAAARRTLAARAGERVCVRYTCDADDNVVFARRSPGPLRGAALATALAACTASGPPDEPRPDVDPSGPPELCDPVDPPVVEDGPVACEGEPPEPPHLTIDVVVEVPVRVDTVRYAIQSVTMGIPATTFVVAPPPPVAIPTAAPPAADGPRKVLPVESRMGALAPELLVGLQPPRRRGDE